MHRLFVSGLFTLGLLFAFAPLYSQDYGGGALIAGIAWLIYAIYETRMYFWAKTVHAPIRVDLLIIAPVLYLLSIVGVVSWVIGERRARRHFRS